MERVATVNSEDSYGAAGMAQFRKFAGLRSMSILASTSFANGQEDLSSSVDALLSSGALVVVLFCQSDDAPRFINAVQAAGGLNITWVGSEAVTSSVQDMVASSPQQAARLRGFAGLTLAGGVSGRNVHTRTSRRDSALSRQPSWVTAGAAMRPMTTAGGSG